MDTFSQKDSITLFNDNCLSVLGNFQSKPLADCIILDPDYQDWDLMIQNGLIETSLSLLKPTGNLICFTKQPFDFNLRNKINGVFRREIVWTFTNGGAWVSNKMPLVSFQKLYWCVKSKDFYFYNRTGMPYSDNTKSFKRSKKVFDGYEKEGAFFEKSEDGIWLRDHLHFNKPCCGKIPRKPIDLINILLHCFCPPNGLVLDPFMGSGVVGEVAVMNKMKYVGIELDAERYNLALRNINNLANNNQLHLF